MGIRLNVTMDSIFIHEGESVRINHLMMLLVVMHVMFIIEVMLAIVLWPLIVTILVSCVSSIVSPIWLIGWLTMHRICLMVLIKFWTPMVVLMHVIIYKK